MHSNALSFYDQYVYTQERKRNQPRKYVDEYGYAYNVDYVDYSDFAEDYEEDEISLYVGPVCGGDGMSIKLAVYGDGYCTEKVEGISVTGLLGYNPLHDNMDIFP